MLTVFRYIDEDGRVPFTDWADGLSDPTAKASVVARILRLQSGNFGDCRSVGEGVAELRLNVGPGYRIYFGRHGREIVLLLGGGSKRTQSADIATAKWRWRNWKRRQQ